VRKEDIERLREEVDLVELVGESMPLEKRGANYLGLCPFHGEKTPSFNVSPARRRYHCFGCGAGGDIFSWVQERELLSFPEAIRFLAERAGIAVASSGAQGSGGAPAPVISPRVEDLRRVCKEAQHIFVSALHAPVGEAARRYLRERGLSRRIIERTGIGFAPADALHHHGCKDPELLADAGLLMGRKFLFAHRIIVPVADEQGRPIGFVGRRLPGDDKGGKYINPPATPLYEKNKVLYGLDRARRALRGGKPLILVEGPLDVIALEQFGVEGAVASSGTAFTKEQAALMARRSRGVAPVLLFDGDRAGQEAVEKAAEHLLTHGLNPRVVTLQPGDDPDSWVRRVGEAEAQDALVAAQPFLDGVIQHLASMEGGTIDQESAREAMAQRWLAVLPAGPMANAFGDAAVRALGRPLSASPKPRRRRPVVTEAPAESPAPVELRPDCLEVPIPVRALAQGDELAAAVWNTWAFVVTRRYEADLSRWGLVLPSVPVQAQPGPLSEDARRVLVQGTGSMLRIQAQKVLAYHHGPIANWRPALSLCKSIADDTVDVLARIERGELP
jgi:DNA primase catalytic core